MKGRGQDAAKFADRDHEGYPPPAAAWRNGRRWQRRRISRGPAGNLVERLRAQCLGWPAAMDSLRCHAAIHNTVSDRQGSRRDTFFRYVHKRLPNGARIGRLGFPEQAFVHQCLDNPIRYFGVGQDEATTLALAVPALALCGGGGGGVGHQDFTHRPSDLPSLKRDLRV